ncbi:MULTISPECIES: hypothetical protein [Streptomyces]|uniref:hypothetical protein n=1 Tax=Streptomyces TaxID=1883 RepID=UPI0036A995C7
MDFETREDRQPQGRKKLTAERTAYFRLMQQGVSNTAACRIVGINRRTGKRWRYGRGASGSNKAAPPMTAVEPPSVPSRYLSVQPELVAEIPGVLGDGGEQLGLLLRRQPAPPRPRRVQVLALPLLTLGLLPGQTRLALHPLSLPASILLRPPPPCASRRRRAPSSRSSRRRSASSAIRARSCSSTSWRRRSAASSCSFCRASRCARAAS